jgi:hypothetical protein
MFKNNVLTDYGRDFKIKNFTSLIKIILKVIKVFPRNVKIKTHPLFISP